MSASAAANSRIRDRSLAPAGEDKIEWARRNMPLLARIEAQFRQEKPFSGLKIALSIHLEAKTASIETEGRASDEQMKAAVTDAGYDVVSLS